MWGMRPYDHKISATENKFVIVGSFGEGYHNYHHTFPWDYATSEYGWTINGSKFFIDCTTWLRLAYDRRRASPEVVLSRRKRTGDLRHLHLPTNSSSSKKQKAKIQIRKNWWNFLTVKIKIYISLCHECNLSSLKRSMNFHEKFVTLPKSMKRSTFFWFPVMLNKLQKNRVQGFIPNIILSFLQKIRQAFRVHIRKIQVWPWDSSIKLVFIPFPRPVIARLK